MTDKQIIIDGVDVSGCCYYNKKTGICSNGFRADEIPYCNCFTCNYKRWKVAEKQLKAKEQECEELKNEYWKLEQGNDFLAEKNSKLKGCLTEIKEIAITGLEGFCPKCSRKECEDNNCIETAIRDILQKISECEGNDGN